MAAKKRSLSGMIAIWALRLLWLLIWWVGTRIYYKILRKFFPDKMVVAPSKEEYDGFHRLAKWAKLSRKFKNRHKEWDFVHFMWVLRCMRCGRSDAATSQVMHTDHIKPVWFYWHLRFDWGNLQVLCAGCNKAKGSHDMTDYRDYRHRGPIPECIPVPVYAKKPLALPAPRNEGQLIEDKKRRVYRPARPKNYNTAAALNGAYHHLPPMEPS